MQEKRSSRYKVPFRIVFAVYGALILAGLVLMILASIDEPWAIFLWLVGALLILQAVVPVFCATVGVKHLLQSREGTRETADRRYDRFASVWTIVLALLSLSSLAAAYLCDLSYPWSGISLTSSMQMMSLLCGGMSVLPLLGAWAMRKLAKEKRWLRICAICLTVCISLGVLFVPTVSGVYNDGGGQKGRGSRYYQAVLYEVIVWDRTHTFGGEPVELTEQRTRVYFFPFHYMEYKAKWELKH